MVSCSGWDLLISYTTSGRILKKFNLLMPGCQVWSSGGGLKYIIETVQNQYTSSFTLLIKTSSPTCVMSCIPTRYAKMSWSLSLEEMF
jgi:hypothetical protein